MEKYITTKQGISIKNLSRNQHFPSKINPHKCSRRCCQAGKFIFTPAASLFIN